MNTKYLIITRGLPGCGKSTFCKHHFDKNEIICPDEIRIEKNGIINKNGQMIISQDNPEIIWKEVYKRLHMSIKYNAKFLIVDFSDINAETCKLRNKTRLPIYKRVSDSVIDNMNKLLNIGINTKFNNYIINHNNFSKEKFE